MIDLLDNTVNRRIINGAFPTCKLYPVTEVNIKEIDFEAISAKGLSILRDNPELILLLMKQFSERIREIDMLNRPELYLQEVNVLINSHYTTDVFNANGQLLLKANSLCPVVTFLDKVLWYGSFAYQMEAEIHRIMGINESPYNINSMLHAWIWLLLLTQKKEIETGFTINLDTLDSSFSLLDILSSSWSDNVKFLIKLTDAEKAGLVYVHDQRKQIKCLLMKELQIAKKVSQETSTAWGEFICLINDLSLQERIVIQEINKPSSPKDKMEAITKYNQRIEGINKGIYELQGRYVNLVNIFAMAIDRLNHASIYCRVQTDGGNRFRLNNTICMLAMNPDTYNRLFIYFHQFRLMPNSKTAYEFIALALRCLKRNLGVKSNECTSIDEMISEFHDSVVTFVGENKEAIETLSYPKLQDDSVIAGDFAVDLSWTDLYRDDVANRIYALQNGAAYQAEIEAMISGHHIKHSKNEVLLAMNAEQEKGLQIQKVALARQVVISLNIIYLFCDALRIMTKRDCGITIHDLAEANQCRNDLLKIDDKLVHIVYSDLGDQEIGMLEYREAVGINSYTLSEQEAHEETLRNLAFSSVLKDSIGLLVEDFDKLDTEQILNTKAQIRDEIIRFPSCDEKEYFADWIDAISTKICKRLVELCQGQSEFTAAKNDIVAGVGEESRKLPASVINTLATAEMLYRRYVNPEYADMGFDYSCISALYYQAFEDAYNDLIWAGYAGMLNSLIIGGEAYTSILSDNRKRWINDPTKSGYLDSNPKNRGFYVTYETKPILTAHVNERCMYKSFAIIMESIANPSKINAFCNYFAKLCGFSDRSDMFGDLAFMGQCAAFTTTIKNSAENRNNASHGGTHVSCSQCKTDKATVLHDLEAVRSNSIGLVQKMLYLLRNGQCVNSHD